MNRRWLQFSLRGLLIAIFVVALLAALLARSWHRTRIRLEYVNTAGKVNDHVRTMQGYSFSINRWTVSGLLFGDKEVDSIQLYPGSYDEAHLAYLHSLFPEATITDSKSRSPE
jgi:hypothetical protein